jgi:DNA-binding NarL/FixJ family response regulator
VVARIHLACLSPLLRRMVSDLIAREQDMEIVGFADSAEQALKSAQAQGANLIITQEGEHPDDSFCAILCGTPLTILAIDSSGTAGTSIRRRRLNLGEDDGNSLAQAVRKSLEPI